MNSEAVEKLRWVIENHGSEKADTEAIRAVLAAIQSAPLDYLKVRELKWRNSYGVWRAETPFGDYMVAKGILTLPLPMRPQQIHGDEEAAQAAAQAHYEAMLKECFE